MKILNKLIVGGSLLVLSFLNTSCDDFEIENPNVPKEKVTNLGIEARIDDFLFSAYSALQLVGSMGVSYTNTAAWMSEACTREATQVFATSVSILRGLYDNNDQYSRDIYRDHYTIVNRANQAIEEIDKLINQRIAFLNSDDDRTNNVSNVGNLNGTLNQSTINTLFSPDVNSLRIKRGEALFLRSLALFWITNTFNLGNVPMPLKVATSVEDSNLPLTPRSEVFDQIIRDLELVKNVYLRRNFVLPQNQLGRVTWGAATSLLGKVYLYNENFQEAANNFQEVVDCAACGYALVDDINLNFNEEGEFNSESIFEVAFLDTFSLNSGFSPQEGNLQAEGTRTGNDFGASLGGGFQWANPSHFIANLYKNELRTDADKEETQDLNIEYIVGGGGFRSTVVKGGKRLLSKRASASLAFEDDLSRLYNETTRESGTNFKVSGVRAVPTRTAVRKFTDWEETIQNRSSGINARIIRFADVKLMLAEALLRKNAPEVATAVTHIDDVRSARGLVKLNVLFNSDAINPPVATLFGLELDVFYKDLLLNENVNRIKNGSLEILPFAIDDIKEMVVDGDITPNPNQIELINFIQQLNPSQATLNLDWNRSPGNASEALGKDTFPSWLRLRNFDVNDAETVLLHLFNKERPAEFAFEGHGILWNDLRRRPGGALQRLEELSQFNYVDTSFDTRAVGLSGGSSFQSLPQNISRFYQDFVERVNNIKGSRLRSNLYLPIPLIALEENDKLLENAELLIRD